MPAITAPPALPCQSPHPPAFSFSPRRLWQRFAAAAAAVLAAGSAHAFTLQVSPQGEVGQAHEVTVRFSEDMTRLGDARVTKKPVVITCEGGDATGNMQWSTPRVMLYRFDKMQPAGARCTVRLTDGVQSLAGSSAQGNIGPWQFFVPGPRVENTRPYDGARDIEEEQHFAVQFTGAPAPQSVLEHTWCATEGVGERVPVRILEGEERHAALRNWMRQEVEKAPDNFLVLACQRRFAPKAKVQIVFGAGITAANGTPSGKNQVMKWEVREPFTASMSCERENANAPCMPLRPIRLDFSAPLPLAQALQARLKTPAGDIAAARDKDDKEAPDTVVDWVQFPAPLPESARVAITLPEGVQDASGRPLENAARFPLEFSTGAMPPLAKFAAAPFGIVERYAEGSDDPALLPITLRRVEPQPRLQLSSLVLSSDAEVMDWMRRVSAFEDWWVSREDAAKLVSTPLPPPTPKQIEEDMENMVEARVLSLLAGKSGVQTVEVPAGEAAEAGQRPFEVVGVPLQPGFQVLELASDELGRSLLDEDYGAQRRMVVRTSVLVTNLGVHFKLGREGALAWVTTLDKGQPVEGATVRVSDCSGQQVATARTDALGMARLEGIASQPRSCENQIGDYEYANSYFVSARAPAAKGGEDFAFTWSHWQRGIENWRFDVPTDMSAQPDEIAHTVLDRSLLRAGETVSMKHFLRTATMQGFGLPTLDPDTLVIRHTGSGQEFKQPLAWRATATGGRSAESAFAIPKAARLGEYEIVLQRDQKKAERQHLPTQLNSGSFRVEEFRLPVMKGSIAPESKEPLIAAARVPLHMQLSYISGGAASGLPVRVSAIARPWTPYFAGWEAFSFAPPSPAQDTSSEDENSDEDSGSGRRTIADRLPVTLDDAGSGKLVLESIPTSPQPQRLTIEASYDDPNGEVQTLSHRTTLWPAGVIVGVRAESWVASGRKAQVHIATLGLDGKPQAGVHVQVRAQARITTSSRKRLVGGFYAYENHTEIKNLGTVCSGSSDARGLLQCSAKLDEPGEIELVAIAQDADGRSTSAAGSIWVTQHGELWFGGENHDRMDVLAEQKRYEPGDVARFQVRMPFRRATALVTVEREGILHAQVQQLSGDNPIVELKVDPAWGPNAYISVLALRGRLTEVPWYSFFTWGFKSPMQWWHAFQESKSSLTPPTAMVDLSRPAFRFGMAEINIGDAAHRINVSVEADRESYPVRGTARVTVRATLPDGSPAAGAEVALAAVDEALLELLPNRSWRLLEAMLTRRSWGVETSTAQMEIVGRRHYGRKALPPGGGGGDSSNIRELFDTLLLWQPRLVLDAQGSATVAVPLNDALTRFAIAAIADSGTALFGSGRGSIRTSQDLQLISGLPPLVRAGDQFSARITLRNTTQQPMQVSVTASAEPLTLEPQNIDIPAGGAREVQWDATAPEALAYARTPELTWTIEAHDTASGAKDALRASQRVLPAVPLTVQQATLERLSDALYTAPAAAPADALQDGGRARGGLKLSFAPSLAGSLQGVRDWLENYPHRCLEQQASRAIGMQDAAMWEELAGRIPAYLDADGLAYYFPPQSEGNYGSDTLTAWLLAATHEAARGNKTFALPADVQTKMLGGLRAFAEGRLKRDFWAPQRSLDARRLAAIEALARHDAATPAMLQGISIDPAGWPTSAVLDWMSILQRMQDVPQRAAHLARAREELRARLAFSGTRLTFATEASDHWWWLMAGGDVNSARLLLAAMNDAGEWQDDIGRLVTGLLARQRGGAWSTTSANLWGTLALQDFSRRFESEKVTGSVRASLGEAQATLNWADVRPVKDEGEMPEVPHAFYYGAAPQPGQLAGNTLTLPWAPGAGEATLTVMHEGSGAPWMTVQALAAIPFTEPMAAGYRLHKTITPVEMADRTLPAGHYSRGDVLRVTLDIDAHADMSWAAISDPIPGGATILGSGLGRDSSIAASVGERTGRTRAPTFEERSFEAFRAYFDYLPRGPAKVEYTMRLNNSGTFHLPPSRAEALYAPEIFGILPNSTITVR